MNAISRLRTLNTILNEASYAYYGKDKPIMSDKEYDDLYDELVKLEKETGCILAGSPTQKVQGYVLDGFTKVTHTKPMLSANKTKDTIEVRNFLKNYRFYCSYKLDGLTLVVRYKDGKFVQGITRGNGSEGEDVTEQCKFIKNLPMTIPNRNEIELRGECVISWEEFKRINSTLEAPYSHPRNLAAGTLRNLDLNIVKERNLSFVVFEMVSPSFMSKLDGLRVLEEYGFECVARTAGSVEECVDSLKPDLYQYPTDGLIYEIDSTELSKALGSTAHHENCRIALKWEDELYTTKLVDIEWNTSKSGLINPVAVFEPVDLDGAITTRATLHNISYIEDLELGVGDEIQVFRANMVIPKVHDNLTRSNTWALPSVCPNCGGNVEVHNENGSKTLHCTNPDCRAKLLSRLVHAVSKNALNIDGMSEATIEFLIERGWLSSIKDIYKLDYCREPWKEYDGFGDKSVDRMLDNIETSRKTTMARLLYSLSIPLICKSASKDIANYCHHDIQAFINFMNVRYDFTVIDGFGSEMQKSLSGWWKENEDFFYELMNEFTFEKAEEKSSETDLSGKTFVITGSLVHYKNRDALVEAIEKTGGKVSGSVSAKTDYLICNERNSNSTKCKKAKELNINILTEEEFINKYI